LRFDGFCLRFENRLVNRSPWGLELTSSSTELYQQSPPEERTSSCMLARLRDWMREHTERKRLVAIVGIDDNIRVCCQAAGFELDRSKTVSSTDWENREGHTVPRRDEWTERRYVSAL